MDQITSKEKVLKNIRNALSALEPIDLERIDWDADIYQAIEDTPDVAFAREFTRIAGQFVYCESENDFAAQLKALVAELKVPSIYVEDEKITSLLQKHNINFHTISDNIADMKVGITRCEYLIARTGSIIVSSGQASGRRMNVYPEIHIVLAFTSQIVDDLKKALADIKIRYNNNIPSMISVISGPSRTADIEKTLVMGAHGPKELFVFLIDQEIQTEPQ